MCRRPEAAVWRSVQFGEGEELNAAEGELPAAHVLLHVLHPAAIPAHTHTHIQTHTDAHTHTHTVERHAHSQQ